MDHRRLLQASRPSQGHRFPAQYNYDHMVNHFASDRTSSMPNPNYNTHQAVPFHPRNSAASYGRMDYGTNNPHWRLDPVAVNRPVKRKADWQEMHQGMNAQFDHHDFSSDALDYGFIDFCDNRHNMRDGFNFHDNQHNHQMMHDQPSHHPNFNQHNRNQYRMNQQNHPASNQHPNHPASNQHPNHPASNQHQNHPASNQHPNHPTSNQHLNHPMSNQHPNHPMSNQHPNHPASNQHQSLSRPPFDDQTDPFQLLGNICNTLLDLKKDIQNNNLPENSAICKDYQSREYDPRPNQRPKVAAARRIQHVAPYRKPEATAASQAKASNQQHNKPQANLALGKIDKEQLPAKVAAQKPQTAAPPRPVSPAAAKPQQQKSGLDVSSALKQLKSLQHRPENLPAGERYKVCHLQKLYDKAVRFSRNKLTQCEAFYRDKTWAYYLDIKEKYGGVMTTYMKDLHGDPRSPINGRIKGLFFNIRVDPATKRIPMRSLFGDRRLIVPLGNLIDVDANLYFTDFYCNFRCHYVTLVLTRNNSPTDLFCRENLLQINMQTNPFFRLVRSTLDPTFVEAYAPDRPIVEVLYTEDVDINLQLRFGALFANVNMVGRRGGGTIGIAKNFSCTMCNLSPSEMPVTSSIFDSGGQTVMNNGKDVAVDVTKDSDSDSGDVAHWGSRLATEAKQAKLASTAVTVSKPKVTGSDSKVASEQVISGDVKKADAEKQMLLDTELEGELLGDEAEDDGHELDPISEAELLDSLDAEEAQAKALLKTGKGLETSDKDLETIEKVGTESDKNLDTTGKDLETTGKEMTVKDVEVNGKYVETSCKTLETTCKDLGTTSKDLKTTCKDLETSCKDLETTDKGLETNAKVDENFIIDTEKIEKVTKETDKDQGLTDTNLENVEQGREKPLQESAKHHTENNNETASRHHCLHPLVDHRDKSKYIKTDCDTSIHSNDASFTETSHGVDSFGKDLNENKITREESGTGTGADDLNSTCDTSFTGEWQVVDQLTNESVTTVTDSDTTVTDSDMDEEAGAYYPDDTTLNITLDITGSVSPMSNCHDDSIDMDTTLTENCDAEAVVDALLESQVVCVELPETVSETFSETNSETNPEIISETITETRTETKTDTISGSITETIIEIGTETISESTSEVNKESGTSLIVDNQETVANSDQIENSLLDESVLDHIDYWAGEDSADNENDRTITISDQDVSKTEADAVDSGAVGEGIWDWDCLILDVECGDKASGLGSGDNKTRKKNNPGSSPVGVDIITISSDEEGEIIDNDDGFSGVGFHGVGGELIETRKLVERSEIVEEALVDYSDLEEGEIDECPKKRRKLNPRISISDVNKSVHLDAQSRTMAEQAELELEVSLLYEDTVDGAELSPVFVDPVLEASLLDSD